jgi:pyruvyltransferase
MKVYYYNYNTNVGDRLTPLLLDYFKPNIDFEIARANYKGKFIGVGSILECSQYGDIIWGTGAMYASSKFVGAESLRVLALRGRLSANLLNQKCETYGDPGLLLPLIYNPEVEKLHKTGYIPHFYDHDILKDDEFVIDILQPIESFVREIKSCERIVSSSLHGIVLGEAYGIPCEWAVWSDRVVGNGFKFHDYLSSLLKNSSF